MAVFLLVHGGFHGGWCWRRVAPHLRAAGHDVYTPTLTGLGERAHLAVRYYLQLGAAAERIAGILADRGIDVSGRTILRWVQKFGPALSEEIRRYRKPVSTTWLVDETYVKILGRWHYLYRGVDQDGQVLDCWLSRTRDLAPGRSFVRRTICSGCAPGTTLSQTSPVLTVRLSVPGGPPSRAPGLLLLAG